MEYHYSNERNVQIVLALLKQSGIKRVIASPGATNITFVASMQQDPWFEIYSCVDERSAAYMACGMAAESGEPVVLSCTGATSSREYMPGLTEAYYRKLPILAITSSQFSSRIGHMVPQVTDRTSPPADTVMASFCLQTIKDKDDEWDVTIKANKALLSLKRNGGGPVHINLITTYSPDFSVTSLPNVKLIKKVTLSEEFPQIVSGKVAIFCGSHLVWSKALTEIVDAFCESNNAVVICDHSSNYKGKYRALSSLIGRQKHQYTELYPDLCIHIGEISGAYDNYCFSGKEIWRVSEDGEVRDLFHKITYVFEMSEIEFFKKYISTGKDNVYIKEMNLVYDYLINNIPDSIPFSNLWIAKNTAPKLPINSVLHLGILNSLRVWNLFEIPSTVGEFSNVGGFGIDGTVSSLIGASLIHQDKLFFGVFGDLSVFYDINILGNRHVGNNVRILMINNGKGAEFRIYNHPGAHFGDDTNKYIAAAGHNGNKSNKLMKHFAEDLGYVYLSATSKEEYLKNLSLFVEPTISHSIIFEVFTEDVDESCALKMVSTLVEMTAEEKAKGVAKNVISSIVGDGGISKLKKFLGK